MRGQERATGHQDVGVHLWPLEWVHGGDKGLWLSPPHLLPRQAGQGCVIRSARLLLVAQGLIPKENIWFPGLMAWKCKYCFSVSNK